MILSTLLDRAASAYPDRESLVDGTRRTTYRATRDRARSLAAFLASRGVAPGDRVSILAWNGLEFLETYFAAAYAGAILNALNVRLAPTELATILRDSGSRWLVADASLQPAVEATLALATPVEGVVWIGATPYRSPADPAAARERAFSPSGALESIEYERALSSGARLAPPQPRVAREDVAHLYYTSGTTGRAKGVMLTHRNVATHALGAIAELSLADSDTWAHVAPMFHLADAWATFAITWAGGRHAFLPRFDAARALALLADERVTITNLVPTMLNAMVRHEEARARRYPALRAVLSGGAPIAPALVREIVGVFGCEYVQTYGMTETSPYLTLSLLKDHMKSLPPDERLAIACKTGRPFATVELRVVGDDGRDVEPDERAVGEIRVRGDTVTPGYWRAPGATADAFEDGWLKTGDLAVIDREGYVTIVDRTKDMINTGGEKVYTTEVEHVLHAHPCVLEAAVYGEPDETWGERVRAAVVLRDGMRASPTELQAFCRERLASYKVPRAIDFVESLPRTGSGKIAKRLLRG